MQVATMQPHQQQNSVYLGNSIPRVSSQQQVQQAPPPTGNVKKWKNKLKTFLNSPLPGSNNNNHNIANSNNAVSSALSSTASTGSSTTATPRPESHSPPSNDSIAVPPSATFSRQSSPGGFTTVDHHAQASDSQHTPKPDLMLPQQQQQQTRVIAINTNTKSVPSSSSTTSAFQSDVYAGYDISVNYGNLDNNNDLIINEHSEGSGGGGGGPNDSYEARLFRLVGDLENVDYGSFANLGGGGGSSGGRANPDDSTSGTKYTGNHQGDGDNAGDISISASLFKSQLNGGDMDHPTYSNHPFAYASAGTPSHLDSSTGPLSSSTSKPFSHNNYLSNSLNFQNQFPLSSSPSSNGGVINIEDALGSFSTPYFNDFSVYTNFDDDLNTSGDIRIPSTIDTQFNNSQAPTPSSSASVPLTAAHSASSNDSGSSTAATSEFLLPQRSNSHQSQQSDIVSSSFKVPFSSLGTISLAAPLTLHQSKSMPFAPFQDQTSLDDEDDDFNKLLRDSQIDTSKTISFPSSGNGLAPSNFLTQSLPSSQSLATEASGTPLEMSNFDLTMFPMPKTTGTASVKMGSQPSSGSESSYGPSPSLSYGGSSTSNTSFDDPNASKDSAPHTPQKSKNGRKGKGINTKNLSISLEESEPDSSIVTISPGFKTPTHSPRPSISSMPPTPASYKTASSVPTSPYRPRPVIHASALAWRVAPSPHSPQSSITVDTTRTLRPVASQSFINTDPFASPTSPSRLGKLSTASSPELKRRRNTADDEDLGSPTRPQGIDAAMSGMHDDTFATQLGNQMLMPMSDSASPLRPIAYRRRVGHKFSNPQLQVQTSNFQQQNQLQPTPALHQRQHSQPLPVTSQVPLQYNIQNIMQTTPQYPQMNSQQLHTRQYTAPLPSPSSAALQYTQQQQHQQQQQSNHFQQQQPSVNQAPALNGSWLSDNIISSLMSQLSDGTYMCLMQNCSQRFASMDETKSHISGHFAPQPVPLQQSSQPVYQQQPQIQQQQQSLSQHAMFHQSNQSSQYPQSQQQTWN